MEIHQYSLSVHNAILTFHSHFTSSSKYFLSELVPHEHSLYWLAAWCCCLCLLRLCTHCTVQYSPVLYCTVQNLTCGTGVMPSNAGTDRLTQITHLDTDTHMGRAQHPYCIMLVMAIDWRISILYCLLSYSTFTQYYLICVLREVGGRERTPSISFFKHGYNDNATFLKSALYFQYSKY